MLPGDKQPFDVGPDHPRRQNAGYSRHRASHPCAGGKPASERLAIRGHESQFRSVGHVHVHQLRAGSCCEAMTVAAGMRVDPFDVRELRTFVLANQITGTGIHKNQLYGLAVQQIVELSQRDKDRLDPGQLYGLAMQKVFELSERDKSRLSPILLHNLRVQGVL